MTRNPLHATISAQLGLPLPAVAATMRLFEDGATIPFIARYRKEQTGGLDEVSLADIRQAAQRLQDLENRKERILEALKQDGFLTPELEQRIRGCADMVSLEDTYLPYRKKRKTRASTARERGLEPLALRIWQFKTGDPQKAAQAFITKEVPDIAAALAGARDIMAEWFAEDREVRAGLRQALLREGLITSRASKKEGADREKYRDYHEYSERIAQIPSHRYLAVRRGEEAGWLQVHLALPEPERTLARLQRPFIRFEGDCAAEVRKATADGFQRLLFPSLETATHQYLQEKKEEEAIQVFADNLRQLLLAPPLGEQALLAIDPGFRTGCKVVVLDAGGRLLDQATLYPHPPQQQQEAATQALKERIQRYQPRAIAIGDGTAGRETQEWLRLAFPEGPALFMVNEDGASIYSASETARAELPGLDISYRGAVSIGRRLMDPMAELVKIDPKSIGVGQYQHDVHQGKLKSALDETTAWAVNQVGVQLNTASVHLLTHVAGIGPALAQAIVAHREQIGAYRTRKELREVPRLGAKAFEQCAGFLRIREGEHPLDNTGIHPERYRLVERLAKDLGAPLTDLIRRPEHLREADWNRYISEDVGLPTLQDIQRELEKPGLDPRGEVRPFSFDPYVRQWEDVRTGQWLPGLVSNLTNFGAFVNLGLKEDGLIHISQIADRFIRHPSEVLRLGQEVRVRVLEVDQQRRRIQLSLKPGP